MRYRKSLEIEQRLAEALRLIQTGKYSTPLLAETLGVSVPTISRIVAVLKERGHVIRAEKQGNGWRYALVRRTRQPSSPDLWPFANASAESRKQNATLDEATNAEVRDGNGTH